MSSIKAELLKAIDTAPNNVVEQTLDYLKALLPDREEDAAAFQPRTALGKQLWAIRQRAIADGMTCLTESEIEQELADRRGKSRCFVLPYIPQVVHFPESASS
jgi:hypothetical protein